MTPTMVTLRELTLNVPTTMQGEKTVFSVGVDNAVKARIEALRKRALAGEDFVTLVSEASESGTKTAGGLVGPVNVDDLNPTLANALADLKPGQVTEPIRGPKGYQLFELEKRNTPTLKPFEDVRTDIEQAIRLERLGPETQKLLERLRTQAVIEWKDENFRKMYEKRAAELAVQNTQAAQTTPAAQTAATK